MLFIISYTPKYTSKKILKIPKKGLPRLLNFTLILSLVFDFTPVNFTRPYFKEVQTLKLLIHCIGLYYITKVNHTFNEALYIDSYLIKL